MIRRPPRSTQSRSSAASDVYKRQSLKIIIPRESKNANNTTNSCGPHSFHNMLFRRASRNVSKHNILNLSLIHISEPTRLGMISYAVFCLKKKKKKNTRKKNNKYRKKQTQRKKT